MSLLGLGTAIAGGSRRADRELDADIYEALGFRVTRARGGINWRYFDPEGRRWLAMGHLSWSIDECSRFIERRHPAWAWSASNIGPEDQPHAVITLDDEPCTDVEASAYSPALALAGALCLAEAAA